MFETINFMTRDIFAKKTNKKMNEYTEEKYKAGLKALDSIA